jgi:hypothetical protein
MGRWLLCWRQAGSSGVIATKTIRLVVSTPCFHIKCLTIHTGFEHLLDDFKLNFSGLLGKECFQSNIQSYVGHRYNSRVWEENIDWFVFPYPHIIKYISSSYPILEMSDK